MLSAVKRIIGLIDEVLMGVEVVVLGVTGVTIIVALLYSAIVRYYLKGSFPEAPELTWFAYTWMVFVGSSAVLRTGDHPYVGFIRDKHSRIYKTAIYTVSIVYLVAIIYAMLASPKIVWMQKTVVLGLPLRYFYYALILGFSFMIIRYIMKIAKLFIG